ncbi:hypothetical protein WJ12_27930 [Burkholderia seminalis]|nr:hypothetical protein WJ12_27930 [Burkholderia seminalis]KVF52712.1 hypothetical protein WJ13_06435 [Burkholderia seminalis]
MRYDTSSRARNSVARDFVRQADTLQRHVRDVWHGHHARVAIDTPDNFRYVRNVAVPAQRG